MAGEMVSYRCTRSCWFQNQYYEQGTTAVFPGNLKVPRHFEGIKSVRSEEELDDIRKENEDIDRKNRTVTVKTPEDVQNAQQAVDDAKKSAEESAQQQRRGIFSR